jgi:hypothetical protein
MLGISWIKNFGERKRWKLTHSGIVAAESAFLAQVSTFSDRSESGNKKPPAAAGGFICC